jgi:hypothetical protein
LGGTASALGGGSFANGAITGAFVVLFNHVMHDTDGYNFTENEIDDMRENGGYVSSLKEGKEFIIYHGQKENKEIALWVLVDEEGIECYWVAPWEESNAGTSYNYVMHDPPSGKVVRQYINPSVNNLTLKAQFHYGPTEVGFYSSSGKAEMEIAYKVNIEVTHISRNGISFWWPKGILAKALYETNPKGIQQGRIF